MPKSFIDYESNTFEYSVRHSYLPDFKVRTRTGRIIYIEAKGNGRAFDPSVRTKLINVRDQHPEIDLRLVFYSDGKIGPKRKDGSYLKQSDWAQKNKFKFAIKEIPEEWLEE